MTSKSKETPRGVERLHQIMEECGATWKQVLSVDLLREGIKPNETSQQLGRWALPEAPSYFERNKADVIRRVEKAEGYYLKPEAGHFGDGASFKYMLDSKSPYEVRYEERGRYRLYRDGDPIEEVFFPPRPQWYDRKTSSGKPMCSFMSQRAGGTLVMGVLLYCEYWKDGNGCRYCNINTAEEMYKEAGLERQMAKRDQDIYETMLAACQEFKQVHMAISGGVILDPSKEADNYARIVRALRRATKDAGYEVPLEVICQAMETKDQIKLKEAGATSIRHNVEVWDPRLFEIICPGKAKYVGRERWLERLLQAVEVFGRGNAISVLMPGLELAPPYGFKDEDEGAASFLEGCEWMLEHGVMVSAVVWRPASDTMFEDLPGPRTEYLLRVKFALQKLSVKHNMPAQIPY